MKSILSICGDPGGAAAVAPVLKSLVAEKEIDLHVLAYNQASRVFANHDISCETLTGHIQPGSFFDRHAPDLLLTGSSMNGTDWEKHFIAEASGRGVPSLAVLDFWSNYRARFADSAGQLAFAPDRVAVMDEQARDEMIAAGFAPGSLIITGQPALDDIVPSTASRDEIRQTFKLPAEAHIVLFVSQPPNPGIDVHHPDYQGFSKFIVLPALYQALENIRQTSGREILLVIRPHPREETEEYVWVPRGAVPISIIRDGSSRDLAQASDLVTGLNSVLLLESCLLKLPVVSLQPGLLGTDRLPTNAMGYSRGVFQLDEIESALADLLFETPARHRQIERCLSWNLSRDATSKVADLAHHIVGTSKNIFA